MDKKILTIAGVAVVLGTAGIYYYFFSKDPSVLDVKNVVQEDNQTNEDVNGWKSDSGKQDGKGGAVDGKKAEDLIKVSFPQPGDSIGGGTIYVTGIARGTWYFEGEFPVRLYDSYGDEIATASAWALGEWMTTEFVPFRAAIKYQVDKVNENAKLVLEKNNPSDLEEENQKIEIPVNLNPSIVGLEAYFSNSIADPNAEDCSKVYPVARTVERTPAIGMAAVRKTIEGPTEKEKELGYYTSISEGVEIKGLSVNNKIAKVDFTSEIEKNSGGSCKVLAIRSQITETLKQFPNVETVIISVDGRVNDALQP